MDRNPSPDIVKMSHDPSASRQRFMIHVRCPASCVLHVETPEGEKLERTLGALGTRPIGFELGKARFQIDATTVQEDGSQVPSRVEEFAGKVRIAAVGAYKYGFIPGLILGLLAFVLTTVLYWRKALRNVSYVLAAAFWLLAFSRATLLILISATSFEALNQLYFVPTYFMVIAASSFSFAAWLQAFAGRASPAPGASGLFANVPAE